MEVPDYYQTLGVSRGAEPEDIKKAYRTLAKEWHPDSYRGENRSEAEASFKRIGEAYEVLSDAEKRRKYDRFGHAWKQAGATNATGRDGRQMSPQEFEEIFGGRGFSEFFASFFGEDHASQFGGGARVPRPRKGQDVRAKIRVPVGQAIDGGTNSFAIDGEVGCGTCGGSGSWQGGHVCPACGGIGRIHDRRTVEVRVPAGVRAGQVIRLKGLGGSGGHGGTAGDLYLTVDISGDGVFEPRGDDLYADLPIAPWEAALGAKVPVTTPEDEVIVTIPAGSAAGTKLRIRGHGLRRANGRRGDLYVKIILALPAGLGPDDIEHLRQIRDASPPPVTGGARGPQK